MKKTVAILFAVALALLCACGKTRPPAQDAAAPAPQAELSLPAANGEQSKSAADAPAENPSEGASEMMRVPQAAAASPENESDAKQAIRKFVPEMDYYLRSGAVRIEQDDPNETVEVEGVLCPLVVLIGADGAEETRRSFAYDPETGALYEYDPAADTWYNRLRTPASLSLEELREEQEREGYLVGYCYIGEQNRIELPDDIGFSYLSGYRIAPAAEAMYPFLGEIGEGDILTGQGDEYYVVVPTDPMATVSVNRMENGEVAEVLYRSEEGKPIVVTADSMKGDIQIGVVDNSGNAITFAPKMGYDAFDERTGRYAFRFGGYECLPMHGSSQLIFDMILEKMPEYAEGGWEMEIVPDQIADINCRPCWLVDMGAWYGNEFHAYNRYCVSEDKRHIYTVNADGAWEEVFYEIPVKAQWGEDALPELDAYDEFVASSAEPQAQVVFTADRELSRFSVLAIAIDTAAGDNVPVFTEQVLHTQETLTPDRPLVVTMTFYGDLPNNGISFVDESGMERRFAVSVSGRDGSLELTPYLAY